MAIKDAAMPLKIEYFEYIIKPTLAPPKIKNRDIPEVI